MDKDSRFCRDCAREEHYLKKVGDHIPIVWIREQIESNPEYAESWRKLIDFWEDALLEARFSQQPVKNDEYVRMHEDPTAAQKFWRNE